MGFWIMLGWVALIGTAFFRKMSHPVQDNNQILFYRPTKGFCFLIWCVPLFFVALLTSFGDRYVYILHYDHSPTEWGELMEYIKTWDDARLFYTIQGAFKILFKRNSLVWFSIIAVFQCLCVNKILKQYSVNYALSMFIFVSSAMIISWMCNGTRQFIAAVLLFACTDWIIEGKTIKCFLLTFFLMGARPLGNLIGWNDIPWILGGVHQSALIIFPIFFCIRGKAFNRRMLLMLFVIAALAILGSFGSAMQSVVSFTEFSKDLENAQFRGGTNPIRFLVSFVPVVLILLKKNEIDSMDLPPIIALSINASVVTALLYGISVFTTGSLVGRLPIYTELYNLILLPWIVERLYNRQGQTIKIALILGYFAYFFFQVNIAWSGSRYVSSYLGMW